MPKIISTQPSWLSRSAPAHRLFNGISAPQTNGEHQASVGKLEAPSLRTLAHRGSEVFVANGSSIRWADLASMKADWEDKQNEHHLNVEDDDPLVGKQFRVLELRYVVEPIVQLCISPNKSLLAVVTAHTIHVCIIPDSRCLSEPDDGTIKPRTQMIGNTTHVLSSPRIVSVLWHPLGVGGNCLVTVTSDAVVRVWELSMQNRSTAEQPTLAIDLRKLRNATTFKDDVLPRSLGMSEGISYDSIGMEVAGACFGGVGSEEESGWSGMTMWIAMTEGDVYALCPLLPSKWQAHPAILSNLASSILAEKYQHETEIEKADSLAQYQWISEQESLPAMEAPRNSDFEKRSLIYSQPKSIPFVPKLQGPFSIIPGDLEYELALADILVIASRLHATDLDSGDFGGMPVSIVCLLTQLASVYVCAELEAIHGQWLPKESSQIEESDDCAIQELVVLGAVETFKRSDKNTSSLAGWPSLSLDTTSQHAFYVTNSEGIWYLSAEQWIKSLESEMTSTTTAGTGFRVGVRAGGAQLQRQKLIPLLEREEDQPSAPLIIEDSDLGHLILTVYEGTPQVAILDSPYTARNDTTAAEPHIKTEPTNDIDTQLSVDVVPRAAYVPSKVFRQDNSSLRDRLRRAQGQNTKLTQATMSEQIRLSPAILELMTHDHRVLSDETHKLGLAIADLFTRCNMMRAELKVQIDRVRNIAGLVNNITGDHDETNDDRSHDGNSQKENNNVGTLNYRTKAAKERQARLFKRFETLRAKTRAIGRPLSDREKGWIGEVDRLARDVSINVDESSSIESDDSVLESNESRADGRYLRRYNEVQDLAKGICNQVNTLAQQQIPSFQTKDDARPTSPSGSTSSFTSSRGLRVPPDIRKQKMAILGNSMERQTALLDATLARLDHLRLE